MELNLNELYTLIDNLQPGKLFLIAGRPAMGKSATVLSIASHISKNGSVCVFSSEMSKDQVINRLKKTESPLDQIHVSDKADFTIADIKDFVSKIGKVEAVVIDNVDMMNEDLTALKELNTPIIATYPLPKPLTLPFNAGTLAEIPGDLATAADAIFTIYRPEYYTRNENDKDKVEISIIKA